MQQVIDEKCECGHLKSEHGDLLGVGHGACKLCSCKRFTWAQTVFAADEKSK